jgi:putative Holliday junction resolvase
MRYLAIDYGTKRTGLAICDKAETIASPLTVIEDSRKLLEKIARLVKTENVEAIVLGLPLNMDDSIGPQAELVFQFAERLKKLLDIPIHFQDERLSTFGAEQKTLSVEFTKNNRRPAKKMRNTVSKKRKSRLDAIAAAEILQTFLDQKDAR